jgi:NAD(P)-dependent dehydrogenase (short-subunit alcohol dehydrogenase family)
MVAEQKVVIITGGARGIGEAAVRKFAENGYQVIVLDILEEGRNLNDKISGDGQIQFFRCDVTNEAEVKAAIDESIERFGRIDVLINNAGVVLVKPLDQTGWDEFQRVVNINLGGTFLLCKYVLPVMKRQHSGSIVNLASVSGHVGQTNHAVYGSTKGAVIALSRALAWEVAPYNIRVNSISPGSVDTPMLRGDIETESKRLGLPYDQVKAEREAEQAFGRWAEPVEIAEAILFLASDKASFITGADLLVDCGWVAK